MNDYTHRRFEEYLETVCFEANPSVLDDDMPDFFENWLGNQDVEDMIRHCNNFLSTSITQAVAEERERVVKNLNNMLMLDLEEQSSITLGERLEEYIDLLTTNT